MTDLLLTWLCSYLLHSSVLIVGLWAAERAGLLARLGTATQEGLWRLALLGGLLSASLPLLPKSVAAPAPAVAQAQPVAVVQPVTAAAAQPAPLAERVARVARPAAEPVTRLGAWPLAAHLLPGAHDMAVGFVALWLAGALLMLTGLAAQWAWLRRTVRRLPTVADPRWLALAARSASDLRLTPPVLRHARPGWASPLMAPGRVLCLPAWCLDLPDDEARAVLGHELAHLRRRDPAWRLGAGVIKALLWPQLLNRLALRRLDLLAELACDAAAAGAADQRLALAQSLLRCAEALKGSGVRQGPALACGAASAGSPLLARVRRLLQPEGDGAVRERRGLRWALLLAMLAGLVGLPAVVISHTDASSLLERLRLDRFSLTSGRGTRMLSHTPTGSFSVTLDGKVEFNDAEDEVRSLTGRLVVREREGGLSREMVLTSVGGGAIESSYRVGPDSQPLDEAGRHWWASAVQRMAEALTDPVVRARKLYARGGFDAVLADVEKPGDDFTHRRRIEAAVTLAQPLPAPVQDRLIAVAAKLEGAFEQREALVALARSPLAEPQQLAWLAAAAGIDGDFERREALGALAPQLLARPAVLAAWGQALARIGGDFEKREAIVRQVAVAPQPAVLAAALQATSAIDGDFEKREALAAVAGRLQGDEAELVEAYTRVARGIGGGFEQREALSQLLDRPRLGQAGLAQVLSTAEGMDAGFERMQVLLRVAERLGASRPVDAALVDRLRRAGRGLGEHERGQLENALDKLG